MIALCLCTAGKRSTAGLGLADAPCTEVVRLEAKSQRLEALAKGHGDIQPWECVASFPSLLKETLQRSSSSSSASQAALCSTELLLKSEVPGRKSGGAEKSKKPWKRSPVAPALVNFAKRIFQGLQQRPSEPRAALNPSAAGRCMKDQGICELRAGPEASLWCCLKGGNANDFCWAALWADPKPLAGPRDARGRWVLLLVAAWDIFPILFPPL